MSEIDLKKEAIAAIMKLTKSEREELWYELLHAGIVTYPDRALKILMLHD